MPQRVIIIQSNAEAAQNLAKLVAARGDQPVVAPDPPAGLAQAQQAEPDVVFLDLHFPGNAWLSVLRDIRWQYPKARIIATSNHPDVQREQLAKEQGVLVFLREPITQAWFEKALAQRAGIQRKAAGGFGLPRMWLPVRIKITLPYMLLALLMALVGAYIITQVVLGSIQDRFYSQLIATGRQNADWMVQKENRMLSTLRLLANTQGMSEAVLDGNAEALRNMVQPIASNYAEDAVEILDSQGTSLLSLRHVAGGGPADYVASRADPVFAGWDFVRYVLAGQKAGGQDKTSGLARASWGDYFYISGPILDAQGKLSGVVLVGAAIPSLLAQMHTGSLADISIYDRSGALLASSLGTSSSITPIASQDAANLLSGQDSASLVRELDIASNQYSEILGPWEARNGEDLGLLGTSLPRYSVTSTNQVTRVEVFVLVAAGLLLIALTGIILANQITSPLLKIVRASGEVAHGNLEVKVETRGNDEVAVLARTFNSMVAGLQEGSMYRDLLGRTVSPEVRDQLRQTFTSGHLRLEGQEATASVMLGEIRSFASLCEKVEPASIFQWLNEYYGEIVPVITANTGVVNKIDGESMLSFFGILPRLLDPSQSAYAACRSALQILAAVERLNLQRAERDLPPLLTGIGINTGKVTAGGLGTADRLHYTIIGETVNTTQRLEALTRQLFNTSGVLISESTFEALGEYRDQFRLDPLGLYIFKGKAEQVAVYRMLPPVEEMQPVLELSR